MAFWQSDLGEVTGNANEAFAKMFITVPDNTMALARIESFTNAEYNGNQYLSVDWELIDGDFKGQKVNQKIKAFDGDPKVKHRSLNMLKLIYQLYNLKPTHNNAPSDTDLAVFNGKIAGIRIRETEPNEKGKQYNWVSEVHSKDGFKSETGKKLVVTHTMVNDLFDSALSKHSSVDRNIEDDVPF